MRTGSDRRFKRRWGRRTWVTALACLVGGSSLAVGAGLAQSEAVDAIAGGVTVDGLELGGKTRDEAGSLLQEIAERKLRTPVIFYSGKSSARTSVRALGGRCEPAAALEAAIAFGRSGNLLERLRERLQGASLGWSVPLEVAFDVEQMRREIQRLAEPVEQPPVEPRALLEGGRVRISGGRGGRLVDEAATRERITAALADEAWRREIAGSVRDGVPLSEWAARARPLLMNFALRDAAPRVTPDALRDVQVALASFSTSFSRRDRSRVHNIRLAARAIDGLILLPGDEFSYNQTVGPRTRRAGFRTAPEIVRGELRPGIGGGVCQVSSTLYNAALLADLEVTRRYRHRFPVSYVAAGRDATVSDSGLDLRLRNRHEAPVVLFVRVEGGRVRAQIFGTAASKRTVRLMTTRLRPPYTRRGGRRVSLIRVVEESGRQIRREVISRDSYEPPPLPARARPRSTREARAG